MSKIEQTPIVTGDSVTRHANTRTGRTLIGVRRFRRVDIDHGRVRASQGMRGMLHHLDRVYPSHGSVQLACRSRDERRRE